MKFRILEFNETISAEENKQRNKCQVLLTVFESESAKATDEMQVQYDCSK